MRKLILITFITVFILSVTLFSFAVYYSFKTVRPAAKSINQDLSKYLSGVVNIPDGIPPPITNFDQTIYFWEMETPAHEVTGVRLIYDTGFSKNQDMINVILEKEEKGDPSIFVKVLPAVITDKQSLDAAQYPQNANLAANPSVGYSKINLTTIPQTGQTTRINWEFKKEDLAKDLKSKYQNLQKTPEPILRKLYSLPNFIISLFSGS